MTGAVRVTVRPAAAADLDRVAALDVACFREEAWDEASLRGEDGGPSRGLLVAELDGEPAGGVAGYAVVFAAGDVADLLRIGVDPGSRRSGVATALLDGARRLALASGADRLLLEVATRNTGALACYEAAGGEVIDTRPHYYRDGDDAYVVRLPLDPG